MTNGACLDITVCLMAQLQHFLQYFLTVQADGEEREQSQDQVYYQTETIVNALLNFFQLLTQKSTKAFPSLKQCFYTYNLVFTLTFIVTEIMPSTAHSQNPIYIKKGQ